ncbi:MAG: hypothetical protein B6D43_00700 [Ignavibacteriales bacterium UTCHB1]|jgi:hypothetical protein|nr:T9SS type A sorting domain-containing protein [Ignavibacteria bacterium]OQY78874.1 MAG: hypothetical protein B6D43_00700 [Ignavibacteriales bacterium UTCHB1]
MKALFISILSFLSIVPFSQKLNAQSFEFFKLAPQVVSIPYIQDSTQFVQIKAVVKNNTTNTINFRFARLVNDLPAGWETQMCYDLCYSPFTDSIPLLGDPDYVLAPNQIDTFFYIDFIGESKGLGTAVVKMYNTADEYDFVQDTFRVGIGSINIEQTGNEISTSYKLEQNYPNPFNPETTISFSIPMNDKVTLKIYNLLGRELTSLLDNEPLKAGSYNYNFNAGNYNLTSGVYFYKLITSEFTDMKKMILVK